MFHRLSTLSKNNSFFLFGARGTGKTSLVEGFFKTLQKGKSKCFTIDLLDPDSEENYRNNPNRLKEEILAEKYDWVLIDEVQKNVGLLDVVHHCIEKYKTKFALTGSSARKLKRSGSNLLAGRAFDFKLHPLTAIELGKIFQLNDVLKWGSLPKIFSFDESQDKSRFLRSYVNTYVKEEIIQEQLVRNVDGFRDFLSVAAQHNGKIINFSNIARDSKIDPKTVSSYFEILRDTLLGFYLESFDRSIRVQQSLSPKFYFFDLGVVDALNDSLSIPLIASTPSYGNKFEHFIILECIRLNDYYEKDFKFSYYRDKHDLEIDLMIKRPGQRNLAIEIKSSEKIKPEHYKNLLKIKDDLKDFDFIVLSQEKHKRILDNGITIYPWKQGLKELFGLE
jgi:predicted AAA+ superfamily ATPase